MAEQKIKWGILGTGAIARLFAEGLAHLPEAVITAVGSRTQATADEFGQKYAIPHRHPTYEALAADPEVEVVYISTPHNLHYENTLLCLEQGKHVLCEKAFTVNAAQAAHLIQVAREKKLFLMEAMWTRYLPALVKVREILAAGTLGEIRMLTADFGFKAPYDKDKRLFNPHLAGGALLDVGIYPVSLAAHVFGMQPSSIQSHVHLGETGVDYHEGMVFGYPGGQVAILGAGLVMDTPREAVIIGTEGHLRLHYPFWFTQKLTLTTRQGEQAIPCPIVGNGYNYEAAEVHRCLAAGELESPLMPLAESLALMQTMDTLRAQWGLVYPFE
jgi:predicted dehydrogenase